MSVGLNVVGVKCIEVKCPENEDSNFLHIRASFANRFLSDRLGDKMKPYNLFTFIHFFLLFPQLERTSLFIYSSISIICN